MLMLHLSLSLLALAAILVILLLPKGMGAHRWLGRLAAAALMLSALSSFGIQARGHLSWLHILSVVTLVNIPFAIWAVRHGRVATHKRAMLINAGGLFVAGLFASLAPGRYLYGVLLG
ncbi:DUF2306 domain-containing protein [Sediminicoccus sp. KRV36]|uniref:DUF2306 domain-containing protein n=1 Tax=Sediminicoccus sp. KRV36 TaxID=3133721 RepID=UPI00201098BB|nr:DUF2306 domain-containing protein [Sediminicoccus rosea]UPY37280.1 DUF2306 domain-containing protein [Sediminicoccus rosea]